MSQSLSCPVCGRQGLPADCANCPQCDSDLTCFQVLDSLSSSKVALDVPPAQKKASRFPWLALLSGTVFVLLLAALAAGWQSKVPGLYRKLTAAAVPETTQDQYPHAVLHKAGSRLSDGEIHIDAQIRILDDRQKQQTACPSSPPALPAADKPAQPEVQQASAPPVESPQAVPAAHAAAVPKAVTEPEQNDEESGGLESQPVELSEPAPKKPADEQQAAAAAPTELPVLQGRRKRAVRTRTVSSLREADVKSAQPKQKNNKSTLIYQAQNGETVWELAERFYGEGKYYPLVMELNPQILQGSVKGGGKVRLLADRRQAAVLYQRNTEEHDGLLLWKHKVQPGETWQSIYARFFPPKYSGMVFYPGDQNVVPGSTVKIILR